MFKYILFVLIHLIVGNCLLDHGPFDMRVTSHNTCKGPKRKNCTQSTVTLEDDTLLKFDTFVLEDVKAIKGKLIGLLNNKELLRLQLKNVCDHIFFGPLFMVVFNQTDTCGIVKGHYKFAVDITRTSRKFYGDNFIYGNWTFQALFYTELCNMHCEYVYVKIIPKAT